ncbi:3-demethylubiquinone-9 3-methyltransferase protein [Marine Group I thaumarchaeote SCGC AAA799-B03]|uniref:3-demethylubiquinone-9 3-methyltransferase protein n=4 Tax=Marine Group I TaxID=905826 RepID=A0A087S709_9ARCH|nr:3-demethylubiquinone-9 3-methyltransferase protein [Marine Group I thaumarchaeote SCGC AAA799-N04]KFM15432.1 3-demethylubiquinone-9 3-methyltransferase protein [Marine Group I thaumarchaeote SCGC AAA799-D11]KFM16672.1 3-demethylubiquinone-9 3-methyltransferase protein [Marine Group I thaumarchaeote SCGC RSA3]KFM21513.1 3-demethylubiquinone-9 3-methyltransferase protein [Marine Group I thaumarchaeote SCGC AAA799-B03]
MLQSSLEFLRCIRCGSKLELDVFEFDKEIIEGIMQCKKCKLEFPIIQKVPILWDDFSKYLSSRRILGGKLYKLTNSSKLKDFVKKSLNVKDNDRSNLEEKWVRIYQNSKTSKFYSTIKKNLDSLPSSKFVLEYGCSIGIVTSHLANSNELVFGVDRSFSAIQIAKKQFKKNLDYFVADSLSPVFGKLQFDLVLALNVLEIIEPKILLKLISKQITKGYFVISDPYDFDRGPSSVRSPVDASSLRTNLSDLGFKISTSTKKPSFIPWSLKLNPRATLNYKVDFIIAQKS